MSAARSADVPEIRRGRIYQDVYRKRVDTQLVTSTAALERARIEGDCLIFEGDDQAWKRALGDGLFLLAIPPELGVRGGDAFSAQFYQGASAPPYGRYRELTSEHFGDALLGFHQRTNQIEQFLLERRFWERCYPPEIAELGEELTHLSRQVIRSVLCYAGIPEKDWEQATGGCTEAAGSYHLTFNHYRPAHDANGLNSHKDDGFITLLRATAPGLEVSRADRWEAVVPEPGYFIINFGLSMEILTAHCAAPVTAIMHRVARQTTDRSTFGHFSSSNCAPGSDEGIYRYLPGIGLDRVCGSRELIDENDSEIYEGTVNPEGRTP
ncbi:2OG-Fe(II) oxygenase family protein [Streptomyces caniferus]|uniref:2OG-Fe(II) oxygenase family protein n=1 Tax=Streptomyces caniferus TaxID=285557 RepID=A0ABZ1VGF5_9ACTN|nr:2OG-Fe(II) oxygenase family protein [Streptomyces caniferus]